MSDSNLAFDFRNYRRTGSIFFCLCGPTASGKSSVSQELVKRFSKLALSISTTTRPPRPNEQDGRDYHFVTREEFESRVDRGLFVEHAEFGGNLYGTEHATLEKIQSTDSDLIFDIEVHGVSALKAIFPKNVVTIFVVPPTRAVLEERLRRRGAENEEQMQRRLERAAEELQILSSREYSDYLVVNEDFNVGVEAVSSIINAERHRFRRFGSS